MKKDMPEMYRVKDPHPSYRSERGDRNGVFAVPGGNADMLLCIFSSDGGWEHLSATVRNKRGVPLSRPPSWKQMCLLKSIFWDDEEAVMQLHPKKSEYVNNHDHCLHLWRPTETEIPLPPAIMVGIKGAKIESADDCEKAITDVAASIEEKAKA